MKLVHLSDLHLGKRLNEFSLLEDQRYILEEICRILRREQPDAVLIAGDIYDKSIPSAEAVQLFDDFLSRLAAMKLIVLLISGNHDSPERVSFGASLMQRSQVYIAPVFDGIISPVTLHDQYGEVQCYLLPFVRPAHVRVHYPDEEINDYQDAVRVVLEHIPLDTTVRNLLVTHQFVAGASLCEAQEREIGGTDQISAALFEAFDYTALGHIHRPQHIGSETIRYCGSPLQYSLSEIGYTKSITAVEMGEKGTIAVREIPLCPLRKLRKIRGTYLELTEKKNYENTNTDDYLHITLTDEADVPDAVGKLRTIYPNLIQLDYDNHRTRTNQQISSAGNIQEQKPFDLFAALYEQQNNQPMNDIQQSFLQKLIDEIWEEKEA